MTKTQAQVRKEVYEYLADQSFEVTTERRKALKGILKFIAETHVEIPAQPPQEHKIKCPDCGGEKIYKGKTWRKAYNEKEFPQK